MNNNVNIEKVTASALEKYLLLSGWNRNFNFPNRSMMVFYKEEDTLAFPSSEKLSDFYVCLPRVIDMLSEIYQKPTREIIKGITASYHDLLEFRIKEDSTKDGKIPLNYASECIEGIKELIMYSACAEQVKQPVCVRATQNAKDILNKFKLAQTEVGSYIINIDIQVAEEEEQLSWPDSEAESSLEHKIVRRIGNAIKQVDKVTKDVSKFDEVINEAYKSGITANMCDALMKMKPSSPTATIETKIRYASACTNTVNDIDSVCIQSNHFNMISEISKIYRQVDNQEEIQLRGYIFSLSKKKVDEVHYERLIHLVADVDGSTRKVIANLGEDDYRIACDAHRDSKEITISGILDLSKTRYAFTSIKRFEIIS